MVSAPPLPGGASGGDAAPSSLRVVNAVGSPLLLLDGEFTIVAANRALCEQLRIHPEDAAERPLEHVVPGLTERLRGRLANARADRAPSVELEVEPELPRLGRRTLILRASVLPSENADDPRLVLLSIADMTPLRQAERRAAAQQAVVRVLAQAKNLDEAATRLLAAFCTALGVEVAELWRPDESGRLILAGFHSTLTGLDPFRDAAARTTFAPGIGIPGRVWQERTPLWSTDVAHDPSFARATVAADAGLRSGFAFPLLADDGCAGVIKFLTRERLVPDPTLLDTLVAIGRDIGLFIARTRAEAMMQEREALQRSERRFREFMERAQLVCITLDAAGGILFCNEYLLSLTGWRRDEVEGKSWFEMFIPPDDRERIHRVFDQSLAREEIVVSPDFENPIVTRTGERRLIAWNNALIHDAAGKVVGLTAVGNDITERKRAEQALQESEERLQLALESGNLGIWDMDLVHGTTWWDPTCRRIFGIAGDELATLDRGMDLIHPEDRARARRVFDEATGPGSSGVYEMEKRIVRPDGTVRWVATRGRVRFAGDDDQRRAVRIVGVVMDVTEQRRAREALEAAKSEAERANALKSRFLAATSHDLRQPLQTLGLLQGVLSRTVRDEGSRGVVRNLGQTIASMASTIDALLDINQLESGAVTPEVIDFPAASILTRMLSDYAPVAETKGLELRVVPCSAVIRSDPRLLERLVENLVANAIKYTEAGKVLVGCRRRDGRVRIEVWDTGIGIPDDQLEAIFEEYHQLGNPARERSRGLGLGLTVVQRMAELLGHRIDVRSALGRGSMFAVEVPCGRSQGEAAPAEASMAVPEGRDIGVLLVEDDASVRESLALFLGLEGYAVTTATTADEARTMVAEGSVGPRVLIADRNLPGGTSGVELVGELARREGGGVPAIVLTGDASDATRREITESGAAFLLKPVDAANLLKLIERLGGERCAPHAIERPATEAPGGAPAPQSGREVVAVVDDDPAIRDAIRALLEASGYEVETFGTAEAFLARDQPERSACLLADVGMPGMDGLELQERLKTDGIDMPVVIITGRKDVPLAVQAMRAGAVDFLQKPFDHEALSDALDRALAARPETADRAEALSHVERLTAREREVLELLVAGHANKAVAARLGISPRTAENHRARVMEKTGTRSLAELVRLAMAAGIAPTVPGRPD